MKTVQIEGIEFTEIEVQIAIKALKSSIEYDRSNILKDNCFKEASLRSLPKSIARLALLESLV